MNKRLLSVRVPLIALCVCLAFSLAFAQVEGWGAAYGVSASTTEAAEPAAETPPPAAETTEAVSETPPPAVETTEAVSETPPAVETTEAAAESAEPAAEAAEAAEPAVPSWTPPAVVETPVVPEPAPVVPEPVVEAVQADPVPAAPAAPVAVVSKPEKAPKAASDKNEVSVIQVGTRVGLGVGGFHGHKAIQLPEFGNYAIVLKPSVATSIGLAHVFNLGDAIGIASYLQYTYYSAHGEFSIRTEGEDFGKLHVAGAELHAIELPIYFRTRSGPLVMDIGPQFGYSVYGKIYANDSYKKPYLNRFTTALSAGVGIAKCRNVLLAVRGAYNFMPYAENSAGKQWTVQLDVTGYDSK